MKEKQHETAAASRSNHDGDGRSKEYGEMRELLLSWQTTLMLIKRAGPDGEKILEILVHGYLIGPEEGASFCSESRNILDYAILLIDAELEWSEKTSSISKTKSEFVEPCYMWLH